MDCAFSRGYLRTRSALAGCGLRRTSAYFREADLHPLRAAQVEVGLVAQRGFIELWPPHPAGDGAQRDGGFQPGERRAQAEVRTGGEGQVLARGPVQVEIIRAGEDPLVPAGCGEQEQQDRAVWERGAVQRQALRRYPGGVVDR